ncbi:MAG: hypothetical protein O6913_09725, partial [Chloroflexi bacterium]|nr:hypothetical protein [Chloroflexota bacterium]
MGLLRIWTLREARSGWRLLLSATVLIVIAGAVLALAPVFRDATADRALERLLDQQSDAIFVNRVDRIRQPPTAEAAAAIDRDITAAAARHLEGLTAEGVRLGISRFGGIDSTPQFPSRFHVFANLDRDTIVTAGRFATTARTPEGRLAVMVGAAAAGEAGINVGDQWTFSLQAGLIQQTEVEVVGLLAPRGDDLRPFQGTASWFDLIPLGMAPPGIGLFVTPAALYDAVGIDLPGLRIDYVVQQPVNLASLDSDDVQPVRQGMEAFGLELRQTTGTQVSTPLARVLRRFELEERFSETPVFIVALQMAAVAVFAVALLGSDFARRSARDRRRLRSRGGSARQELQVQAVLGLVVALPAVALSAPLAAFALAQAGRTPALDSITGGATLDTRLSLAAWGLAAAAAVIAWLAFTGAAWLQSSSRAGGSRFGLLAVRPGVSILHRYYLDLGLLAVGGVLFWQFDAEASRAATSALGGDSVDPVLLLSPGLLIAAIGLVLARVAPVILEQVSRLAAASRSPTWIVLALLALARDPGRALRLLALTLFTAAIGTIAATYSATLDQSAIDRVAYEAGADLRAVAISPGLSRSLGAVLSSVDGRIGVAAAAAASRNLGSLGGSEASGTRAVLLAVQPDRFAEIVTYRDDFAADSLETILSAVTVGSAPAGIELPADATSLAIWVRTDPPNPEIAVQARIVDSSRIPRTLRFGRPQGG